MDEVRRRLDAILASQRGPLFPFALSDTDYFIVVGLYPTAADLVAIRPALRDEPDRPALGVGPRDKGYPVYVVAERPPAGPCCAEYRGVWFSCFPMLFIE